MGNYGGFMQELDCYALSYLTCVKKEIIGLNITNEYRHALIKCVEKIFNPNQLLKDIYIEEYDRKLISAESVLVSARHSANEDDVIFACPYQIENNILHRYRAFISRKLK